MYPSGVKIAPKAEVFPQPTTLIRNPVTIPERKQKHGVQFAKIRKKISYHYTRSGHFVASLIPARSLTFMEIDDAIVSMVILLPSTDSLKNGCCIS